MPPKQQSSQENRQVISKTREFLLFISFIGCYFILDYGYFMIPDDTFINVIHYRGLVSICAELINWITPLEHVLGKQNQLMSAKAELNIVRGCDGAGVFFVLISAILVFPSNPVRKLIGLAQGISLIYVINLIRICILYFIMAYQHDWFVLIHVYVAPTFMLFVGCAYFAWWAFSTTKDIDEPA